MYLKCVDLQTEELNKGKTGMENVIYLDNAATTFPKSECVYERMNQVNRTCAVNSGRGAYGLAAQAASILKDTREQLLKLAGAEKVAEVVFTASATLASNQIFGGITWNKEDVVYVSPFEHNAIMRVLHKHQKELGFEIEELALDEKSLELDLEKIHFQFIRKKPDYVVMSHVSNVTGYILPIQEVAQMAKEQNALVVVDGAQALGLIPISLKHLPVDFYIFAGHKTLCGAFGVGGYIKNSSYQLKPFLAGGTGSDSLNLNMPDSAPEAFEPGSPNIVAIAGLQASIEELRSIIEKEGNPAYFLETEQELTEDMVEKLQRIGEVELYLPQNRKYHAGIIAFNIAGLKAADVGMILDQDYNIAVRTGHQCAPLISKYLHNEDYAGVVRASVGRFTTKEEIDTFVRAVREIAEG